MHTHIDNCPGMIRSIMLAGGMLPLRMTVGRVLQEDLGTMRLRQVVATEGLIGRVLS